MSKFERFLEKHRMLEWDMYTTEDMEQLYKLVVEDCAKWVEANSDGSYLEDSVALKKFFLED